MHLGTVTTAKLGLIDSGPTGIWQTLQIMRNVTREGKKALPVRMKALELVENLQQKNYLGEIKAIHAFVRDYIRYVGDINGVETIHTPEKLLEIGQGDCDDKCVLVASMLESIGHPTRFVAIGFRPGDFSHVYVETQYGREWLGIECTEPVAVGWQPKNVVSRMVMNN